MCRTQPLIMFTHEIDASVFGAHVSHCNIFMMILHLISYEVIFFISSNFGSKSILFNIKTVASACFLAQLLRKPFLLFNFKVSSVFGGQVHFLEATNMWILFYFKYNLIICVFWWSELKLSSFIIIIERYIFIFNVLLCFPVPDLLNSCCSVIYSFL